MSLRCLAPLSAGTNRVTQRVCVFYALHRASVSKSAKFRVVKNGKIVEGNSREKAISAAFFWAHKPSVNDDVYSLMKARRDRHLQLWTRDAKA